MIYRAVGWITRLESFAVPDARHPLLGADDVCVTTIHEGLNINSVPDSVTFTIDFRSIPSNSHEDFHVSVSVLQNLEIVVEDPVPRCARPASADLTIAAAAADRFIVRPQPDFVKMNSATSASSRSATARLVRVSLIAPRPRARGKWIKRRNAQTERVTGRDNDCPVTNHQPAGQSCRHSRRDRLRIVDLHRPATLASAPTLN